MLVDFFNTTRGKPSQQLDLLGFLNGLLVTLVLLRGLLEGRVLTHGKSSRAGARIIALENTGVCSAGAAGAGCASAGSASAGAGAGASTTRAAADQDGAPPGLGWGGLFE